MLQGLIRYDEVAAGHIDHAMMMTAGAIANTWVWPASHTASSRAGSQYPPMGTRFRLKANVDTGSFTPHVQTILTALKTYGVIITDNGASWHLSGVPDSRWDDGELHALTEIPGSSFEAVDESGLIVDPSSGQVKPGPIPTGWVNIVNKLSGKCLDETHGIHSLFAFQAGVGGLNQSTCTGGNSQKFQFVPVAGGWSTSNPGQWLSSNGNGYMISSAGSGLQLAVPNGSTQYGALMVQAAFSDEANWIWSPVSAGYGYFYIQSLGNGLVLDNTLQTGYANGSSVQQWQYLAGDNQLWQIVPASN